MSLHLRNKKKTTACVLTHANFMPLCISLLYITEYNSKSLSLFTKLFMVWHHFLIWKNHYVTRILRYSNSGLLVDPRISKYRFIFIISFVYEASLLWNNLPVSVQEANTKKRFRILFFSSFFLLSLSMCLPILLSPLLVFVSSRWPPSLTLILLEVCDPLRKCLPTTVAYSLLICGICWTLVQHVGLLVCLYEVSWD